MRDAIRQALGPEKWDAFLALRRPYIKAEMANGADNPMSAALTLCDLIVKKGGDTDETYRERLNLLVVAADMIGSGSNDLLSRVPAEHGDSNEN